MDLEVNSPVHLTSPAQIEFDTPALHNYAFPNAVGGYAGMRK